jgi:hypothetical protein
MKLPLNAKNMQIVANKEVCIILWGSREFTLYTAHEEKYIKITLLSKKIILPSVIKLGHWPIMG